MIYRGFSRGFGFVEYETEEDAKKALTANGVEFEGRKLIISVARPPRERKPVEKKEGEKKEEKRTNGPRRGRRFPPRRRFNNGPRRNFRGRRQPRREKREESENILFVKNLAFTCKDEDLKTLFKEYNVTEAKVITFTNKKGELRSKGFGFVDVKAKEDQEKAIAALNKTQHMERTIFVSKAFKRPEAPKKE